MEHNARHFVPSTAAPGAAGVSPAAPRYEDVYRFRSLLEAFRRARRAKRGKGGEPAFYRDLEDNLLQLSDGLHDRWYRPDPYRYFKLFRPKERIVSEASFRDRVVHHSLVAALEPVFEPRFIDASYACRRGKGVHAAVGRCRTLCRRLRYFLRLDVRHYFDSIRHPTLLGLLGGPVRDEGILWLCATLLNGASVPGIPQSDRRGVPIGNLTSQFWANVYLDPLDHFVVDALGAKAYCRYMDDIVIFSDSKPHLWRLAAHAGAFAGEHLGLDLKKQATRVGPTTEGVPWLGLRVFPGTVRLDRASRSRFCRKLAASVRLAATGPEQELREKARSASLCGHVAHANTRSFRQSLLEGLDIRGQVG